jgi:hypothetical protein
VHDAQRDEQLHTALRGHTSVTARRGAATHTGQHKSAIAILRHSILVTVHEAAAAMHAQYS